MSIESAMINDRLTVGVGSDSLNVSHLLRTVANPGDRPCLHFHTLTIARLRLPTTYNSEFRVNMVDYMSVAL